MQIYRKHYSHLNLSPRFERCFGQLPKHFIMCVWGGSGNGKSDFAIQLANELAGHGKVLYMSLEMGQELSLKIMLERHKISSNKILFTNHEFGYGDLFQLLEKRGAPQFIVVDSCDYLGIDYNEYKQLKKTFYDKAFIFLCHARYQQPASRTAEKIRYDADVKVRVEGFVAFVRSRFGGNKNYLIWRKGAERYWGKEELEKML